MDIQKLLEYRNTHNPFAQQIGLVVEEISTGYAKGTKTVLPQDENPSHTAHGGIYFTIADAISAAAMASYGYEGVTLNASFNFMRAAKSGDVLTAEAIEVKHGKTICVFDTRVTDQNGRLLSTGTFTYMNTGSVIEL